MLAVALTSLLLAGQGVAAEAPESSDVRVLIDISGSMRQNDPNNLRRPAMRMLAGLMQPGNRAGVWTFARWVNNLVPVADVDDAWKKRMQSLSKKINSPGQFTNIEDVLDRASRDWRGEPSGYTRHIVLLTDGMVDVSKKAPENAASRARILAKLLPRLQAAGVKVHTIALSERADHELMERLAGETGGWYQQVLRADELQRAFLKMFETVGNPDTLPLQDNRFVVDSSVDEATVLVFRKPDSPPAVLLSPEGVEYTDSDLLAGIAWYRDEGYELVTISAPQKGEWRLHADVDPDNRVMIVTDLKLKVAELPNHVLVGEALSIDASLLNAGELVVRRAFLDLVDLRADAVADKGRTDLRLNDVGKNGDEMAQDGHYSAILSESQPREVLEVVIAVDSPTFMREKRLRLVVHEAVEARVEEAPDGLILIVEESSSVMQPGVDLSASQGRDGESKAPIELKRSEDGTWRGSLVDSQAPVYVDVSGRSRQGMVVERTVGPVMPPGVEPPLPVVEPAPQVATEPDPVGAAEEPPAVEAEAVENEPVEPPVKEVPVDWLIPAAVLGGFNVILLVGVGVWYLLWRRRKPSSAIEIVPNEADTPVDAPSTETAAEQKEAA